MKCRNFAHRGFSGKYPENTMAAFIGAKKQGANWAELDVQQTKDGYIVVSVPILVSGEIYVLLGSTIVTPSSISLLKYL